MVLQCIDKLLVTSEYVLCKKSTPVYYRHEVFKHNSCVSLYERSEELSCTSRLLDYSTRKEEYNTDFLIIINNVQTLDIYVSYFLSCCGNFIL
jgi:hypothetical protein